MSLCIQVEGRCIPHYLCTSFFWSTDIIYFKPHAWQHISTIASFYNLVFQLNCPNRSWGKNHHHVGRLTFMVLSSLDTYLVFMLSTPTMLRPVPLVFAPSIEAKTLTCRFVTSEEYFHHTISKLYAGEFKTNIFWWIFLFWMKVNRFSLSDIHTGYVYKLLPSCHITEGETFIFYLFHLNTTNFNTTQT